MAFTHTVTFTHSGGSTSVDQSVALTSGSEQNLSEAVADSTSDGLVAFTCDFSQLKALTIKSDQDISICTNDTSGGSPDQTLTITANIPYVWVYGSGITCPITTDITALYVTNASGSTANLEIRALEDPTV